MFSMKFAAIFSVLAAASGVFAEDHTVSFENNCGSGTPTLISQTGQTLLTGTGSFTSNAPLVGAIAYLQNGPCLTNGEHCTTVETTLQNAACAGCGSSTDITLIDPHQFNVKTGFHYINGCDGLGASCDNANCDTAFHDPSQTFVQRACQTDNVDLVITFC